MKKVFLLIFCGLYYPLFSMDDSNIFEIDSDELRELKEIAKIIESSPQVVQQEQKVLYHTIQVPKPLKVEQEIYTCSIPDEKILQQLNNKNSLEYTCVCGAKYYRKGWFERHLKECKIANFNKE